MPPPSFEFTDLTPQRRKHLFHSDAESSTILTEEAEFHALTNCNSTMGDLQIQDGEGSTQDNP